MKQSSKFIYPFNNGVHAYYLDTKDNVVQENVYTIDFVKIFYSMCVSKHVWFHLLILKDPFIIQEFIELLSYMSYDYIYEKCSVFLHSI